jgi:hypothetical protein
MRKILAPTAIVAITLALALVLVGCTAASGPVANLSSRGGSGPGGAAGAPAVACAGGSAVYANSNVTDTLSANCAIVTISGSNVTLTAQGISTLVVAGSHDRVMASDIGQVSISGASDTVLATTTGAVNISGTGETVTAQKSIGAVVITGSGNTVTSPGTIASVEQSGTGNTVGKP